MPYSLTALRYVKVGLLPDFLPLLSNSLPACLTGERDCYLSAIIQKA